MVRRTAQPAGELICVIESSEKHFPLSDFDLTFDSTNDEIIEAVAPAILEEFGTNIQEEGEEGLYTVKKLTESGNIYLYPKSPAGVKKHVCKFEIYDSSFYTGTFYVLSVCQCGQMKKETV